MNSETIYIIILLFLCADFIFERFLEGLNIRAMSPVLPEKLKGIYDEKEYKRFRSYKKENNRFGLISSAFSFTVTVLFLAAGGFGLYNDWIVSRHRQHPLANPVLYAGLVCGIHPVGNAVQLVCHIPDRRKIRF